MRTVGNLKVEKFLEQIIKQFPFPFTATNPFLYEASFEDILCSIKYQSKKKLLAHLYTLTLTIQFPCLSKEIVDATYLFHKQQWKYKTNPKEPLSLEKLLPFNWGSMDLYAVTYSQKDHKGILQLSIIPGSYTILVFPPLNQGITLLPDEVEFLTKLIKTLCLKEESLC
jgi:hypothetical protein